MEINVWNKHRWFVPAVAIALILSTSLTAAPKQRNPTSSSDVQENGVSSTSTLRTTQVSQENVLTIKRNQETSGTGEGRIGVLTYNGEFICYTLEHEGVKIPAGRYKAELRWSERFQETVPYIHAQNRTGIEIHPGNCSSESGGCVLVGTETRGACLGNSRLAFARMMRVLPQEFTVVVE